MTIEEAYKYLAEQLKIVYEEREATNIADWVFENISGIKRLQRIGDKEKKISDSTFEKLASALKALLQFRPVQYVLGETWFYKMKLFVNEYVLIPRPETEELVNWISRELKSESSKKKILDIGTGSGCIAIALKKEVPGADVTALDISNNALLVAKKNAVEQQADIEFIQLDFLQELQRQQLPVFDIVVSNPPYIPEREKVKLEKNVVDFEPHEALFVPDNDPLIFYKAIAIFAQERLSISGKIYVEIHEDYADEVSHIFLQHNFISTIKKDMYEKTRMVCVYR